MGGIGDDARPLREHVKVFWRKDSKASGVTVNNRFYSSSVVYAQNKEKQFVAVKVPGYKALTGFSRPESKDLRPCGRMTVKGWDAKGRLIYDLFMVPMPTFEGNDPLVHRVLLEVSSEKMVRVGGTSEKGVWERGDWIKAE